MRLRERLARLDDRSVIYRADDPEQRVRWGLWIVSALVGTLIIGLATALAQTSAVGGVSATILLGIGLLLFVCYIPWRRRRNRQLTGSPTEWPGP